MPNEQTASGAQVPCISLLECPFCGQKQISPTKQRLDAILAKGGGGTPSSTTPPPAETPKPVAGADRAAQLKSKYGL
jgi:hypothetical protein